MLDARDSKMNKGKPLLQVASSPANLWKKSKTKICTERDTFHNADKHDDMANKSSQVGSKKRSRKISQVKKQNIFTSVLKQLPIKTYFVFPAQPFRAYVL